MIVTRSFTSLAAAAAVTIAGSASADDSSRQVQLGVTATVVRPAEIITFAAPTEDAVAFIRNLEAIEVVADGGIVRRSDGDAIIVPISGASSVIVTLVF